MESKEYYQALEKVLHFLSANPQTRTEDIRDLAGGYWGKIENHLKSNNLVTFLANGTLWNVNRKLIGQSLADVQIILGDYCQEKKDMRNNRLWDIALLVLDAVIAFYAGWFLRGCTPEYDTASGMPEPPEQSRSIIDSTSASTVSSSDLNAVSTPSLAKSLTTISDNSASTRFMCNTLTSSIQMDAAQSFSSELPL